MKKFTSFKQYKSLEIAFVLFFMVNITCFAQTILSAGTTCPCSPNTNKYPSSVLTPSTNWQVVYNQQGDEYNEYNVTCGYWYDWSYCSSIGGNPTGADNAGHDLQLNLTDASNNSITPNYWNCNDCGVSPSIGWIATFNGIVRVHTRRANLNCNQSTGTYYDLAYKRDALPSRNVYGNNTSMTVNGTTVNLGIDVCNDGQGGSTCGSFYVGYYASINSTVNTSDIFLGDDLVSTLTSGNCSWETASFNLCSYPNITNGTYYIGYIVDYANALTESDNTDNDGVFANFTVTVSNVSVPTGNTVSAISGTTSISVISNGAWSASENCSWVTISPTSGTGNGNVTVTYQQNTSASSRSCDITFTGCNSSDTYTLTQDPPSCTISVSAGSMVSEFSGTASISITSNGASSWSASESCSWVTISPTSGTGDGTVTVTYQSNTSINSRTCTITFTCGSSTDTYILTQSGVPCTIFVPNGTTVSVNSGTTPISVTSNGASSWAVNESCSWLTVSPTSGTGNGTATVAYQSNTSINSRTCSITFTCGSYTDTYALTQSGTTNVKEIPFITSLSVYPNPTTGTFTLEMELTKLSNFEIKVLNILGQVVYEEKLRDISGKYQKAINMSSSSKGIYNLQLINNEEVLNKKIILQ